MMKAKMEATMDGTNRHPADRLAHIRQTMADLKDEEAAVKEEILALTETERCGTWYEAVVSEGERKAWATAALVDLATRLGAGEADIEACRTTARVTTIRTKEVG